MAPKRGRTFGGNRGNNKKKKFNLISIRQQNDYRKYGEAHPADDEARPTKYTRVKDTADVKSKKDDVSSSSDSEEETPALQQLLQEIGVKEEEPDSEQEDSEENDVDEEDEDLDDEEAEDLDDEEAEDLDDEEADDLDDDEADEDLEDEEEDEDIEDDEGLGVSDSGDDFEHPNVKDFFDDEAGVSGDEEEDDEESEEEEHEDKHKRSNKTKTAKQVVGDTKNGNQGKIKDSKKKMIIEDSSDEGQDMETEENAQDRENAQNRKGGQKKLLDISSDEDDTNNSDKDDEDSLQDSDPFSVHFETEVEAEEFLEKNKVWMKKDMKIPGLGKSIFMYRDTDFLREIKSNVDLKKLHVKHKLCDRLTTTNTKFADAVLKEGEVLSSFQYKLFNVLNTYQDLLYPKQTVGNTEEIRLVYCLHALNHVLKSRSRIMAHNAKLKSKHDKSVDDDIEYRDQGLTRPKVVILCPYREKAKKVVNIIINLLSASERLKAGSLKRFLEEYSEIETRPISASRYKAEDYLKMFEGNIDDNFRVGLSISKMNVKLYSPFYASDIIVASPLGLRTLIGDAGDEVRDFDFLSSIEMLIMDQSDVYMMQNWDHILHSLRHFHQQPKESHDVDFSRVRMWAIDGLSKYFRQTIIFSSVLLPELTSVFNKYCHNYCGKILIEKIEKVGTVRSCLSDVPQIFHRVACTRADGQSQRNAKLEYFKKKILPLHTSSGMKRTIIYCNYFSFVTLRNFLREEDVFFLFIHEYDWEKDIKKNRVKFRKLNAPFMFYTERLHFHYRFRMRGVYHIVWFDVPQYPIFYPELINLLDVTKQACTSTCLFTKFEGQKMMEIVGQKNASHMLNSEKSVNMITVS